MLLSLTACKSGGSGHGSAPHKETTLLVYMVGSDLEAKGGAGTNDMQEMLDSQVDLSSNNVLLYAGGTKKWHNDFLADQTGHAILQLTSGGFQTVTSRDEVSMGEAETLSYFLNYAYENYPADNFALILWDHGNGPLIGYGKDMLHEDDSLTLLEMRTALENSPFSGENKLAWVGFDACLMSSVELACIWQDHAEYLIASQEIEPSFGWNYSFLQQLSKKDTEALATDITNNYMDSCLAYYERRNYGQRDTTLACMNLSRLAPLKTALETLFTKVTADVAADYSTLVSTRVNTRALGRATTGSEYDLIDLADMARQLQGRYPDEAAAVVDAATELVVHNVTNAENCCGLSIYYPFYNKSYYEKAWGDVYQNLNVLPAYTSYLEAYAGRWLQNDLLQSVASSIRPQAVSSNEYKLTLTDEQAANFADASYYVLYRRGHQLYTPLFSSSNVKKQGNELLTTFDGNVIYAKNSLGQCWIPVMEEHDTVGNHTRYSTYVNLVGGSVSTNDHRVAGHRFHITVNNTTNEVNTSALVPYDTNVSSAALAGGKLEDTDLSQWDQFYFLHDGHYYLRRDENGVIMSLSQWKESGWQTANAAEVGEGIEFYMAPVAYGEYYVLFEIEDVQGNRYCSELLPIQSGTDTPTEDTDTPTEEPVQVTWESGDKVKLFSQEGVTLYLTTVEDYDATRFIFHVENQNDFAVEIQGGELAYNDTVYCADGYFGGFTVPAKTASTGGTSTFGETVIQTGDFDFGYAEKLGMLSDMHSLQFTVSVVDTTHHRTLIHDKYVDVRLSDYAAGLRKDPPADSWFSDSDYYSTAAPAFGVQAGNQVLFNQDGLRGTLLGMGGDEEDGRLVLTFRFDNTTDDIRPFNILGLSFDNVFVSQSTGVLPVPAQSTIYYTYVLHDDDMATHQVTSASRVQVWTSHKKTYEFMDGGFAQVHKHDIQLAQSGAKATLKHGSTLLYQDAHVRIYLDKSQPRTYGGYEWICTLENIGDRDILLASDQVTVNGAWQNTKEIGSAILTPYDTVCPAGQTTVFDVTYIEDMVGKLTVTFVPNIYDATKEEFLYEGTEIVLKN